VKVQSRIDNSETRTHKAHDTERRQIKPNIENQNGEYHGIHHTNREGVCVKGGWGMNPDAHEER